jgi:hypothetical protein
MAMLLYLRYSFIGIWRRVSRQNQKTTRFLSQRWTALMVHTRQYSSALVSTGNTFQDLPRLCETVDTRNTER